MDHDKYKVFLENQESITSISAISSRLSKASSIEKRFNVNLDDVITNDLLTYSLLKTLKPLDHHGNDQNTVRYYYKFKNGKKFPNLKWFEQTLMKS